MDSPTAPEAGSPRSRHLQGQSLLESEGESVPGLQLSSQGLSPAFLCLQSSPPISLLRTPGFGFRTHPSLRRSHLEKPAKNCFLDEVPCTVLGLGVSLGAEHSSDPHREHLALPPSAVGGRLSLPPSPTEWEPPDMQGVPPKNTENETRLPPSPHLHVQRGRSPPGVQVSGGSLQVSPAQPPLLPPLPSARLISHSPHGSRPQSPPSLADRPVQEARKQFSKPLEKTVDLDLSGFQHLSKKNCYFPFKHHAN